VAIAEPVASQTQKGARGPVYKGPITTKVKPMTRAAGKGRGPPVPKLAKTYAARNLGSKKTRVVPRPPWWRKERKL